MATYAIVKRWQAVQVASETWRVREDSKSETGSQGCRPLRWSLTVAKRHLRRRGVPKVAVTGRVLEHTKGPKIRIHKFKNKTGYHSGSGTPSAADVLK